MPVSVDNERALFSITLARLKAGLQMRHADSYHQVIRLRESFIVQAVRLNTKADAIDQADAEALVMGVVRPRTGSAVRARCHALELIARAKALEDLEVEFQNASFDKPRGAATPEQRVRGPSKATSLYRLFQRGRIQQEHLAAAEEIEEVYLAVIRPLCVRSRWLDGARGDSRTASFGPDYGGISNWQAHVHSKWFKPWCKALKKDSHLDFVMAVVIDGMAVDKARRQIGWDYDAALKRLIAALDLWGEMSNLRKRLHARIGLSKAGSQRGPRQASETSHTTSS